MTRANQKKINVKNNLKQNNQTFFPEKFEPQGYQHFSQEALGSLRNLIIGSGIQNTAKPNKLLAVMTVCRHDFNNGSWHTCYNLV